MDKDSTKDHKSGVNGAVPIAEIERDLNRVLTGGVLTKSYEGTLQYSHKGMVAHGLVSFNAVRSVMAFESRGFRGADLIREMLTREMAEQVISIGSTSPSAIHVDPGDIYKIAIFSTALKPISIDYSTAEARSFETLLQRLRSLALSDGHVAAAVLAKSPEILAVFALTTREAKPRPSIVYAVFDPHARPVDHPYGAAFTFFGDAGTAAEYLVDLSPVGPFSSAETPIQWQAELVGQFSAHIYIAETVGRPNVDLELFKANIETLDARCEIERLRTSLKRIQHSPRGLHTVHRRLLSENQDLKDEVAMLRLRLSRLRNDWIEDDDAHRVYGEKRGKMKECTYLVSMPNRVSLVSDYFESNYHDDLREERYTLPSRVRRMFLCAICMDSCSEDALANVEGCDHAFCRECLLEYVKSSLEQNKFPIICPSCLIDEKRSENKTGVVTQGVLQILGVSEQEYERWVNFGLEDISVLIDCRSCRTTSLVDKGDYDNVQLLTCPRCQYTWCKMCQQPVACPEAADHSCDGTKELNKLMLKHGWKNCPGCQIPTEKTIGCNHMACPARGCNTHFCYIDGQLICKGVLGLQARDKVKEHYQRCQLFNVPEED